MARKWEETDPYFWPKEIISIYAHCSTTVFQLLLKCCTFTIIVNGNIFAKFAPTTRKRYVCQKGLSFSSLSQRPFFLLLPTRVEEMQKVWKKKERRKKRKVATFTTSPSGNFVCSNFPFSTFLSLVKRGEGDGSMYYHYHYCTQQCSAL